jgi:hypothetical protein
MAPRKKASAAPAQNPEPQPESPVISNDVPAPPIQPVNVAPVRVERPAARSSSRGGKGGGKSDGSKSTPGGKGFSTGHSQGTSTSASKKKAKKKHTVKGQGTVDRRFRQKPKSGKKTRQKAAPKRFFKK